MNAWHAVPMGSQSQGGTLQGGLVGKGMRGCVWGGGSAVICARILQLHGVTACLSCSSELDIDHEIQIFYLGACGSMNR